jgi:hypothetical protein
MSRSGSGGRFIKDDVDVQAEAAARCFIGPHS